MTEHYLNYTEPGDNPELTVVNPPRWLDDALSHLEELQTAARRGDPEEWGKLRDERDELSQSVNTLESSVSKLRHGLEALEREKASRDSFIVSQSNHIKWLEEKLKRLADDGTKVLARLLWYREQASPTIREAERLEFDPTEAEKLMGTNAAL